MERTKLRWICTVGIGIGLYVALSLCLQVPVFENYYLCLGYIVMAVYCHMFGPVDGAIVGVCGTLLYCVITNGLRGMPGWTIGNLFIAVALGLVFQRTRAMKNQAVAHVIDIVAVILSTVVGILILKSFTEVVLYAQPMVVRMGKNVYGTVSDAVVLVVGIEIARIVGRIVKKEPLTRC